MTRFIKTCSLTAGGLFLTLSGMDCLYSYGIARHPLLRIPEKKEYDYVIIGDSRVSSLIEDEIGAKTGKSVIVLPHYGDNLKDVLYLTDYFLERGNRAKTVISTVDLRIAQSSQMSHDWEFYAYDVKSHHYLKPRIPFVMYASNNRKIPFRKVVEGISSPIDSARRETRDFNIFQRYEPSREQKIPYDTTHLRLDLILALREKLKKHGIHDHRLIVAPLSPDYPRYHPGAESYKDIMRRNGFRLYDCSKMYADTAAFADLIHLKRKTYMDFSRRFADSLLFDDYDDRHRHSTAALKTNTR